MTNKKCCLLNVHIHDNKNVRFYITTTTFRFIYKTCMYAPSAYFLVVYDMICVLTIFTIFFQVRILVSIFGRFFTYPLMHWFYYFNLTRSFK